MYVFVCSYLRLFVFVSQTWMNAVHTLTYALKFWVQHVSTLLALIHVHVPVGIPNYQTLFCAHCQVRHQRTIIHCKMNYDLLLSRTILNHECQYRFSDL